MTIKTEKANHKPDQLSQQIEIESNDETSSPNKFDCLLLASLGFSAAQNKAQSSRSGVVIRETSAFGKRRIVELVKYLEERNLAEFSSSNVPISISSLSEQLFKKAVTDSVLSRGNQELESMLIDCARAISNSINNSDGGPISVVSSSLSEAIRLVVVMPDRPFIVQSIATILEGKELDPSVLLHPIITIHDQPLSLVYLEFREKRPEIVTELIDTIKNSLNQIILCTDDYSEMRTQLVNLANKLASSSNSLQFNLELSVNDNCDNPFNWATNNKEVADLINWLLGNSFLFLGSAVWHQNSHNAEKISPKETKGILRSNLKTELLNLCIKDIETHFLTDLDKFKSLLFKIIKLPVWSEVQRSQRLNHLMFKVVNEDQSLDIYSLVGLFTVAASNQPSKEVPIIRRSLATILKEEQVKKGSHDYKFITRAIDNMPRELSLNLHLDAIREFINVAINVHNHGESHFALHLNRQDQRADLVVVVPKSAYSSQVSELISQKVEQRFDVPIGSAEMLIDHSADPQVRIYLHINLTQSHSNPFEDPKQLLAEIQADITLLTQSWREKLEEELNHALSFDEAQVVLNGFKKGDSFPADYRAKTDVQQAKDDILTLLSLTKTNPLVVAITEDLNQDNIFELSIYSKDQTVPINKSLPILENFGLEVQNSASYDVVLSSEDIYFINRIECLPTKLINHNPDFLKSLTSSNFPQAVTAVLQGDMENDVLNNLVLGANLPHKGIRVLRAYSGYLWQVIKYATRGTIYHTLARSPQQSAILWELFQKRFAPVNPNQNTSLESLSAQFTDSLRNIKNINQDRILRALLSTIQHTVRTNFYQSPKVLAFKFASRNLDILPNPKPLFEIYVRSTEFEGVHLRNGKTARGGIRWSERTEDYRQEVLGLMKTQTIKNVLIVPTGAKGGFAVRYLPEDVNAQRQKVEECYKDYIRALLSITDNIVDGKVVHPNNVVVHDEADPYFVVAADKGTATFSDLANSIAINEFSFWLGDAFASGGSNGYDHKKYGITARGAFESVKRHFHDLGIDYINNPFTCIGIGDMSGDVFGNGMLLSDQLKLVAAFNHAHIFIDPDPIPDSSFQERKRLFNLPRSKWSDYNPDLISKGGGVYGRFDKEIILSLEARRALGIDDNVSKKLNGEEIIKLILKAPVTLLWNGGIGTYVKSTSETNNDVNDGTNDQVRINASDLRVKVVGEGGNLGFTQLARIEFARKGGRIITDAIDNSAGVDLSDHEVNIKLALKPLVERGELLFDARNQLLVDIVPDVVESVLEHNKNHSAILSLGLSRSLKSIHYFQSLLRDLEKKGYIDRGLENLPSAEELLERAARKEGLHMPELAVCMAAVKMWISDQMLQSTLVQDPLLEVFLLSYFPEKLREEYSKDLIKHPLRREIIASQITNSLIDAIGITFVHRVCSSRAVPLVTVVKCAIAAEVLLESSSIRKQISILDTSQSSKNYMKLRGEINASLRHVTAWLIGWHGHDLSLDKIVQIYKPLYSQLVQNSANIFTSADRASIENYQTILQQLGLNKHTSEQLSLFKYINPILNILTVMRKISEKLSTTTTQTPSPSVISQAYFSLIDSLRLKAFVGGEEIIDTANKWEHQILLDASESIGRSVTRLTTDYITNFSQQNIPINQIIEKSKNYLGHQALIDEIESEKPTPTSVSVLARQLEGFSILY